VLVPRAQDGIYLRDVFTRLPSATNWQVKDLTPEAWAKSQQRTELRAIA
jgi:hypothetical protein